MQQINGAVPVGHLLQVGVLYPLWGREVPGSFSRSVHWHFRLFKNNGRNCNIYGRNIYEEAFIYHLWEKLQPQLKYFFSWEINKQNFIDTHIKYMCVIK